MKECKECGFPRRMSRFLEWHGDGTVVGSARPRISTMFLQVDEWETIFEDLAGAIGMPVDRIVVEAQKNIGKDLYGMVRSVYHGINLKRIPSNRFLRPQWLARFIVWGMRRDLARLGAGRPRVIRYRAGKTLVLGFSNPCMVPLMVGNCLGIYESIEKMPGSESEYGRENGDLIIRMAHADEKPESEGRLYLEEVEPGTGTLSYNLCPRCGVPLPVARALAWDISRGIIKNRINGEREGMIAVQSVNAILRELEKELGGDVIRILYNAQKNYSGRDLQDKTFEDPGTFWDSYLTNMALRGLGYPDMFERNEGSLSVEISTAYNQDLYAARLAAGLEKVTGRESRIEWDLRERHHGRYTITTGP
ncbi:MAG: hypothetical protein KKE79_04280 [Actinobacteria bacterium]|nr:hypothetical protein [Actinomycetota bacterium]MCG2794508.1 hypothetical protein [Actinomycetes bacterium]